MLRIDPLTEKGIFDSEFYASKEYTEHYKLVKAYLEKEGFNDTSSTITIQLGDHLWCIRNTAFEER